MAHVAGDLGCDPAGHRDRDRSQACGAQRGDGTLRHEPDEPRPDADNALPRFEPIIKDGPAAYWTRLPLRAIINDFARDGIPATLSSDAGTFVCNSLFYQLLHWTATQDRVLAGFVSFPPINGGSRLQNGLDLRQQVRAGRDVVRETVRYYLQPSSGDILIA